MAAEYKIIDPKTSNNEYDKLLYKYCMPPFRKGYIQLTEYKYLMPIYYTEFMDDIENFEVFDTDIFVLSHPKTGTTWTQEMVWCIANNMQISTEYIYNRFPFLELTTLFDYRDITPPDSDDNLLNENSVKYCRDTLTHPRFIKSHLPWELLPKQIRDGTRKPKMIYVYRNPKDVCVSYYHHYINLEGYHHTGDFQAFVDLFLNGRINFGPYPEHIKSMLKHKHLDNLLFLQYENMKLNLKQEIVRVMQFLNKHLTDKQIDQLVEHLSFESMRNNNAVNYESVMDPNTNIKFMRSGIVGSYKAVFTSDINAKFDKWIDDNFNDTNIKFSI